jgi:1-deoxy-D-xylulose-5-phosphate reductoisomerase
VKVVSIFGVTGSIGSQALDFIRSHNNIFSFHTFVCDKNFKLAKDFVDEFKPKYIYFSDKTASEKFRKFKISSTVLLQTYTELKNVLLSEKSDIYLSAISSSNLLELTSLAASSGGKLLLANKESLVVMGEQILNLSKQNETEIVPIDSEHYSVMNLLRNKDPRDVKKVYLTASGGPFFNKSIQEVANKSLEEALKHPTWEMGKKITIDSATLINKFF